LEPGERRLDMRRDREELNRRIDNAVSLAMQYCLRLTPEDIDDMAPNEFQSVGYLLVELSAR
jgi:hypothetical protein